MNPTLPMAVAAAAGGCCLGSFVATASLRAVREEQAVRGRSRCDHCGVTLGLAETVPILSYVSARGACRACAAPIDPAHLAGEAAGGAIVLSVVLLATTERAAPLVALGLVLLGTAVFDARTRRLPDVLTLVVVLLGLGLALLEGALVAGAVAAVSAFIVLEAVRRAFLWARRSPGLGFGDVKLVAALALWLGVLTPWAVVVASVLGLLVVGFVRPADGKIAFGPMIASGAFVVGMVREAGLWPL